MDGELPDDSLASPRYFVDEVLEKLVAVELVYSQSAFDSALYAYAFGHLLHALPH